MITKPIIETYHKLDETPSELLKFSLISSLYFEHISTLEAFTFETAYKPIFSLGFMRSVNRGKL